MPEVQDKSKVGPARLDLEHAPKAPPWAMGKGLEGNTTYTLQSQAGTDATAQQQPSGAAGPASADPTADPAAMSNAQINQAQRDQRAASVIPGGATKQSPAQQSGGTELQPGFIGKMALLAWLFLTLIYIQLFKISLLALIIPFVLFGMPIGLGLSWLFFYQLGAKKKISAQVFSLLFVLGKIARCRVQGMTANVCANAVEHHTWAERSCSANRGCAILDQLPGQGKGQGMLCATSLHMQLRLF